MRKSIEKIIREYSSDTDYSEYYWKECVDQICSLLVDRLDKIGKQNDCDCYGGRNTNAKLKKLIKDIRGE